MPSCSTSSNLLGNVNISNISNSGARLLMTHPLTGFSGGALAQISGNIGDDGFTAGDVIRYDVDRDSVSVDKYIKAQADVAGNSEVVGIIESFSGGATGNEQVNIVLSGQIAYPAARLTAVDGSTGSAGGDDVYFLSETIAGGVQNLAPEGTGNIAKPVLQAAADDIYNAHVVNYIGYQIGGSVNAHTSNANWNGTVEEIVDFAGAGRNIYIDPATHQFALNKSGQWLPTSAQASEYTRWLYSNVCDSIFKGGNHGVRHLVSFTTTLPTDFVGKNVNQVHPNGSVKSTWTISGLDRPNNTATLEGINIDPRSGLSIDIDVNKPIYLGFVQFSIDTSTSATAVLPEGGATRISFSLPEDVSSGGKQQFRDIKGATKTYNKIPVMRLTPDEGIASVSIADNITLSTIEVLNSLTLTNVAGTSTSTDVAQILKDHDDDIKNVLEKTGLTKTETTVT